MLYPSIFFSSDSYTSQKWHFREPASFHRLRLPRSPRRRESIPRPPPEVVLPRLPKIHEPISRFPRNIQNLAFDSLGGTTTLVARWRKNIFFDEAPANIKFSSFPGLLSRSCASSLSRTQPAGARAHVCWAFLLLWIDRNIMLMHKHSEPHATGSPFLLHRARARAPRAHKHYSGNADT